MQTPLVECIDLACVRLRYRPAVRTIQEYWQDLLEVQKKYIKYNGAIFANTVYMVTVNLCKSDLFRQAEELCTCGGDSRGNRKPWNSLDWSEWQQRSRLKIDPTVGVQRRLEHDRSTRQHGSCRYAADHQGTILPTSSPCLQLPNYLTTGWGKIKYPNTKIAISQKCLNIFAPNFAHLFITILCTNVFVLYLLDICKLQERISQLNKKLTLLLKQLSNKYHLCCDVIIFYVYMQHSIVINSSKFQVIIAVRPITLVMGKIS